MEVSAKDNSQRDIEKAMEYLYNNLLNGDFQLKMNEQKNEILIRKKILAD